MLLPKLVLVVALLWLINRYVRYRLRVAAMLKRGFVVVDRFLDFSMGSSLVEEMATGLGVLRLVEALCPVSSELLSERLFAELERWEKGHKFVALVTGHGVTLFTNDADVAEEVRLLPSPREIHTVFFLLTQNSQSIKATRLGQTAIDKRVEVYGILEAFGPNLVTTRGDEWKRHRQVCAAAFSKSNLKLVRTATVKNATLLLGGWERRSNGKPYTDVMIGGHDDLMRFTLATFGEAIFGCPMNVFGDRDEEQMATFCDRFLIANDSLLLNLALPKWLFSLPIAKLHRARRANELVASDVMVRVCACVVLMRDVLCFIMR